MARIARWGLALPGLNIKHHPGKRNANADALSRAFCNSVTTTTNDTEFENFIMKQQRDPFCSPLIQFLQNNKLAENEAQSIILLSDSLSSLIKYCITLYFIIIYKLTDQGWLYLRVM